MPSVSSSVMPSENVTTGPVRLHYTLTSDDLLDGFAAQHLSIRHPWYLRWLSTLLVLGVLAVVFGSSVVSRNMSAGSVAAFAIVFVVTAFVIVGLSLLLRQLLGVPRWIYRLPVRNIMRGNPALSQPMQATVTDTAGESTTGWPQYPVHVETDQSFVLLASQRRGAAVLVLPKRGLAGSDPAPLRALLATHSRRLA
jgi:hypothetical protein